MGKRRKGFSKKNVESYGSDDERAYEDEVVPDPDADGHYHDEVDEFHANREKILLNKGHKKITIDVESDQEQEVYGMVSDDDSDDEQIKNYTKQLKKIREITKKYEPDSDVEEEGAETGDGLPDSRAWGTRRHKYYGADVEDDIDLEGSSDEDGAALLEEKEALAMQKKMAEELDEQDFGLEIFKKEKKEDAVKPEGKIVKDLSKMSKKEKLALLKKQAPEFLTLIDDYKEKMKEVNRLMPLQKLCREKNVGKNAALYVQSKIQLNLNYCINISFYMVLKSKQIPVHQHPVINRLVQFRNLMKQLESVDEQIKPELDQILSMMENGESMEFLNQSKSDQKFKKRQLTRVMKKTGDKKKLSELVADSSDSDLNDEEIKPKKQKRGEGQYETKDEKAALEYYKMMRKKGGNSDEEEEDMEDFDEEADIAGGGLGEEDGYEENEVDGKRGITYQISKNKGLTAKKKKELRNPRVKHRMKFKKALIRRKGQIREVRKEITPYGGELSGIRASIKRGIKLH